MDAPAHVRGVATRADSRRVLVVDDDVDFADGLRDLLEPRGYAIETAPGSRQALKLQEAFGPEVALLDVRLGRASGVDLAAELKRRRPNLICIMVTAYAETDTAVGALRAGADDYLRKPFEPAELLATLERAFAKQRLIGEKEAAEDALRRGHEELEERVRQRTAELESANEALAAEIVERKRAEETLQESKERFRNLVEGSIEGIMIHRGFKPLFVNDAFAKIFRFDSPEEVLALDSVLELAPPHVAARAKGYAAARLRGDDAPTEYEYEGVRKDGSTIWLDNSVRVVSWMGEPAIQSTVVDITERKRAEEALREAHDQLELRVEERTAELRDTNEALRESEERYRELFEESPIGIWESDWSGVRRMIDGLAKRGVKDWRAYFERRPEQFIKAYDQIALSDVSRAILELYGVPDVAALAEMYGSKAAPPDNLEGVREALISFIAGRMESVYEAREHRSDGTEITTRKRLAIPPNHHHDWSRVIYAVADITERKRAEEELERTQFALDHASDAAIWLDLDGRIVYANTATCIMLGHSREELLTLKVLDYDPDASLDDFSLAVERIKARGPYTFETRHLTKAGNDVPVEVSLHYMRFGDDELICSYSRDITERKRTQEALRQSETQLRLVTDNLPLLISYTDSEERFRFVNAACETWFGRPREEIVGKLVKEIHADSEYRKFGPNIVAVLSGRAVTFQRSVTYPDGTPRDVEVVYIPDIADAGRVRGFFALSQDITERRRAEAVLREREARLRHAQRIARLGHWEWRSDGDGLELSPEAASILGIPPDEPPISFAEYTKLTHPDDASSYEATVGKAIEDHAEYEAEFRIVRPDGVVRFVRELGEPLYGAADAPIGIRGAIQDVTEQKRTQAQLFQSSKLVTLGEMATAMAHELSQPLNVIRMAADSTIERIEEGAADAKYLGVKLARISAQTVRAARIIDHMRIFGRKADDRPEAFDPREVVTDTIGLVGEQLHLRSIAVETNLPERCRKVLGHAMQLEQVLLNLITNARHAIEGTRRAPGDRRQISLTVEDQDQEDEVTLTVTDTGGGIPEAAMSHIFEPFFTTKEPGQGTGLGLSVSYGIITDMDGTIDAANGQDGAVFTITLPAIADRRSAVMGDSISQRGPYRMRNTQRRERGDRGEGAEVRNGDQGDEGAYGD